MQCIKTFLFELHETLWQHFWRCNCGAKWQVLTLIKEGVIITRASGWQLLDAPHFPGSLVGILYSHIVLDKCNRFVFQWQLLELICVLGPHGGLLAGGHSGYSLPLAEGELTWPGASGTNLSAPVPAREELIVLACSCSL